MSANELKSLQKIMAGAASAIAATLVIQCGVLIWWASGIDCRVERAERDLGQVCERVRDLEIDVAQRHPQGKEGG